MQKEEQTIYNPAISGIILGIIVHYFLTQTDIPTEFLNYLPSEYLSVDTIEELFNLLLKDFSEFNAILLIKIIFEIIHQALEII